jgi:hypothetical protein
MLPSRRASSAAASNPTRIIFATCNRLRSAAKRATNLPYPYAARITARSVAPATSRPGGMRSASTPSRSPVTSGNKFGSTIRKMVTRRVSRRARRLDRLPRHLTVQGMRGLIRVRYADRTTVGRREQHGRPPQYHDRRPALSPSDGTGFADLIVDGKPDRCAASAFWPGCANNATSAPGCAEPGRAPCDPQCAGGACESKWRDLQ